MAAMKAPWFYRQLQRLLRWSVSGPTRFIVTGTELVPVSGAVIIAPNHVHLLDVVVMFVAIPRHVTVFAAEKWRGTPGGWLMQLVAHVIYVAHSGVDRQALAEALQVLRSGEALGLAPEGRRSPNGALQPGKDGLVYLASRSGAPILPVATWGQDQIWCSWRHVRRPEIHVHIGELIRVPPEAARTRSGDLAAYTEEIMLALARMLPERYRGAYAGRVQGF
jgi:1-acyl-sn-glycerol-3-phosphate acyltransferase